MLSMRTQCVPFLFSLLQGLVIFAVLLTLLLQDSRLNISDTENEMLFFEKKTVIGTQSRPTCSTQPDREFLSGIVPKYAPLAIHEYVKWHSEARECICNLDCKEKPDVLVLRCTPGFPCGGVGDRIGGVNLLFLLSIASGRLLFVDFPAGEYNPFDFNAALWTGAVDWRLPKCNSFRDVPHLDWYSLHPPHNASLPNGQALNLLEDDIVKSLSAFPELSISSNAISRITIGIIRRMNQSGDMMQFDPTKLQPALLFRIVFHIMFRPSEAVINRVKFSIPEGFVKNGYAGVHARIGEDVNERKYVRFRNLKNYSEIASGLLQCAMGTNGGKHRLVFLASDSQSLKRAFSEVAGRNGIEVATIGGKAIHIAHPLHRQGDRPIGELCQEFINVFADLFILGNADSIVMNGSGFARTAFYIGNASDFLVFNENNHAKCGKV